MLRRTRILRINHIGATNGWLKARPRPSACSPTADLPQTDRDAGLQGLERVARLRDYPGAALRPAVQD